MGRIWKHYVMGLVITGVQCVSSHAASVSSSSITNVSVRLQLKTGRAIECTICSLKKNELTVRRILGSGTVLTEFYRTDSIDTITFPKPHFLSVAKTQDVSTARLVKHAVKQAEKEYRCWRPFEKIRGNWAAPVGFQYALLLEKQERYKTALPIYKRIGKQPFFKEIRRRTLLRQAVCCYHLGMFSNTFTLSTNALKVAGCDAERAEAGYYLGVTLTEFCRPADSLLILLKNVVFYHMHIPWEAKSLVAVLKNYTMLGDEDRIRITCDILVKQFPDTVYADSALQYRKMLDNKIPLTEIERTIHAMQE
jgi:hypothetical protein